MTGIPSPSQHEVTEHWEALVNKVVDTIAGVVDGCLWHPSKRSRDSDGAAGETLEILLGLSINNDKKADTAYGEIKTFGNKTGRVTLFSREPEYVKSIRKDFFENYHYLDDKGDKCCNIVLSGNKFNTHGLKIDIDRTSERINIIDKDKGTLKNYWDFSTIEERLKEKHGSGLLHVGREDRKLKGSKLLEYRFTSLTRYSGVCFERFLDLIDDGTIVVETRMRYRSNHKQPWKNRGTCFRVPEKKLLSMYDNKEEIR